MAARASEIVSTAGRKAMALVEFISGYFSTPVQVQVPIDLTKTPEKTGTEVVETVVDRIGRAGIFGNDYGYIRRACWVETRDGADTAKTFRKGYHGGLWQVDEKFFLQTKDTSTYPILLEKHEMIKSKFDIDWPKVKWEDLRAPLHCVLAVSLYMLTRKEPIPQSTDQQAEFHNKNYPNEKPDDSNYNETFIEAVAVLETIKEGTTIVSAAAHVATEEW